MYKIAIKSGTSGYYDYDGCDMIIAEIPSNNIPRVGEIIHISGDGINSENQNIDYLVREVKYSILIPNEKSKYEFGEWIYAYVIKVS